MIVGFAAALAGMVFYAAASVLQGFAATRAEGAGVVRHPAYLCRLGCDAAAWVVSLVAMRVLPLFVVQSLLAGSLALTVLLAIPVLHVRPTRRDLGAILVVTAAVALVAASSGGETTATAPGWYAGAVVILAVVTALVAAAVWRRGHPLLQGAVSGVGFAGLALASRAVTVPESAVGAIVLAVLTQPAAWALLVLGGLGAVMYARGLELGSLGPVTAVVWVVEVVLPGAVGVAVLGDTVRAGWAPAALVGVGFAIPGCVALALSPTQRSVGA